MGGLSLPLLLLPLVHSLNILFYVPTLSYSHIAFNSRIADELVSRGHDVFLLLAEVDDSVRYNGSGTSRSLRVSVGVPPGLLARSLWTNPGPYEDSSPLNPRIFAKLLGVSSIFVRACEGLAANSALLSSLREESFDVGVVEQYDSCGFGLFQSLGIPSTVWISATNIFRMQPETLGVNYPISYVPELFAHVNDHMGMMQKLENILIALATQLVHSLYLMAEETKIFRRLGVLSSFRSLGDVARLSHSLVSNTHLLLDFPSPQSQQMISVAGITNDDTIPALPLAWHSIVDEPNEGFILVTFGAIAKTRDMPPSMASALSFVYSSFPNFTFIVKDEGAEGVGRVGGNVVTTPWLPQMSLMAHPNYRGIITHGGWSSILESLHFDRPMVLLPLFADHAKNSQIVIRCGVGEVVDKMGATSAALHSALHNILHEPRFAQNCRKFGAMLREKGGGGGPVSHGELIEHRFRRAAATGEGGHSPFVTPREAFLSPWTVRGGPFLSLLIGLLILLLLP